MAEGYQSRHSGEARRWRAATNRRSLRSESPALSAAITGAAQRRRACCRHVCDVAAAVHGQRVLRQHDQLHRVVVTLLSLIPVRGVVHDQSFRDVLPGLVRRGAYEDLPTHVVGVASQRH